MVYLPAVPGPKRALFSLNAVLREDNMTGRQATMCRIEGCNQHVAPALQQDGLCLDHFVEGTYRRARRAVEAAQKELPLEAGAFEWMFEDAKLALKALVRDSDSPYREGLTELITALANVHEYLQQQIGETTSGQNRALDAAVGEYAARRAAGIGQA